MAFSDNVEFCRVTYKLATAEADSFDSGQDPDSKPIAGQKIRLRASVSRVTNATTDPPVTHYVKEVEYTTNADGELVNVDGTVGVYIIPTDSPALQQTGWTWTAVVSGNGYAPDTFSFVAPSNGHIDLSTVPRVPLNPGSEVAKWAEAQIAAASAVAVAEAARDEAVEAAGAAAAVGATTDAQIASRLSTPGSATRVALTRTARKAVGQGELFINVRDYGAVGDGVTDDSPAFTAALAECRSGSVLFAPGATSFQTNSTYMLSSTVALLANMKFLGGGPNNGTILKALTPGMVVVSVASATDVEGVKIDGAGIAAIGYLTRGNPQNKPFLKTVRVENCTQFGFCFVGTQNMMVSDCMAQYNKVNYAFLNGCANMKMLNCNGNNTGTVYGSGSRSVLVAHITDNPLIPSAIYAIGNRNLSWDGGIYERTQPGSYQIEILNMSGNITFSNVELSAATIATIRVGPLVTDLRGTIDHCQVSLNGGTEIGGLFEGGEIEIGNDVSFSGSNGRNRLQLWKATGAGSVTMKPNAAGVGVQLIPPSQSTFHTGIRGWVGKGGGELTHDPVAGTMNIKCASDSRGAQTFFTGGAAFAQENTNRYIDFRISAFEITTTPLVTASPKMNIVVLTTTGQRIVGAYSPGDHRGILYKMQGDELGLAVTAGQFGDFTYIKLYMFTASLL